MSLVVAHFVSYCYCLVAVVSDSFAALWTITHLAPLSMGFPRQEHWNRLPFRSPRDLPEPGMELCLLYLPANSLLLSHLGRFVSCYC